MRVHVLCLIAVVSSAHAFAPAIHPQARCPVAMPALRRRHVVVTANAPPSGQEMATDAASANALENQIEALRAARKDAAAKLAAADLALAKLEQEREVARRGSGATAEGDVRFLFDYDYGYLSKSNGVYVDTAGGSGATGPPANVFEVASKNFVRELRELVKQVKQMNGVPTENDSSEAVVDTSSSCLGLRQQLDKLELSNAAVTKREEEREQIPAPLILKLPYISLCWVIDTLFEDRPLPRFWFLETVARMPYFSYISMLHLYESLGWWRRSAEIKRVHFAEEWNEFHHLLIMEALGGDQRWSDRFFAQHAAVFYYWVLVVMWLLSPSIAYNFSALIEAHAVDTYGEFRDANEALLKQLPPPQIALQYYCGEDLYYFDEFQTARSKGSRRPKVQNLYDVFANIADDEAEHVNTMKSCQDPQVIVRSPNAEAAVLAAAALAAAAAKLAENAAFDEGFEFAEGLDITALLESISRFL